MLRIHQSRTEYIFFGIMGCSGSNSFEIIDFQIAESRSLILLRIHGSGMFFFELRISESGIHIFVTDWWIGNAFFE